MVLYCEMIAEIERLRGFETAARDLSNDLTRVAKERDELQEANTNFAFQASDQAQEIERLRAEISEQKGMIWKTQRVEKEQAARIKELEDALVEGLTNFLHYRASCYDPARRCPYAKECDDCSTWDACGHVEKFRSEARQLLQAEGKIGPDAKPRSWQITEERKAAIWHAVAVLKENDPDDEHLWDEEIAVLRAMLEEAE